MSEVRSTPQQKGRGPHGRPQQDVPPTILSEQLSTYAFGTVTAGAVMVAVAVWMGGSLASIDDRIQTGWDATAKATGFTISNILVEGLDPRSKADVLNALALDEGQNMFRADPFILKERIESNVQNISNVRVLRQWPSDIWIVAENRRPLALWQEGGQWKVIDQAGKIMDAEKPTEFADLPRVVGPAGAFAAPELLETLQLHPEISEKMAEAMRVGGRRWDIRLKTGLEISFPEDAELDRALLAVFELNEATGVLDEGSDVKRIDARDPDHFAVGLGVVRADIKQEAGGA
jgi:cell division protein FtsQ